MFTSVPRPNLEGVCFQTDFQNYMNLPEISEDDKQILSSLSGYFTTEAIQYYSSAFDSTQYNGSLEEKIDLLSADKINDFWSEHKRCVKNIVSPSDYCPVCGVSYNHEFDYTKTIEHVLPKSRYQQYILSPINLVYFCNHCNSCKGDEVNESLFHPYFSNITCTGEVTLSIFERNDHKIGIKVEIHEENETYIKMIKKSFKLHKNYLGYIEQVMNKEISSIELAVQQKLTGIDSAQKLDVLKDYLSKYYSFNPQTYYVKTPTERMLLEKLKTEIETNYENFAQYILEKLKMN
ncbi:hypothetical protein Si026_01873 [Streptococcus infantarius subsp. infantarius]|nr:hypothetical protein [Streptococcus infantarius subsp. infantarius]